MKSYQVRKFKFMKAVQHYFESVDGILWSVAIQINATDLLFPVIVCYAAKGG